MMGRLLHCMSPLMAQSGHELESGHRDHRA